SPTGYVFICVFVVLSSLATFWPPDFFNNNLANLSQLNDYLPFILLVFVPAITMSLWADERRQGTDELLLTIPASDLDVVLGKYFAAVAIFTVSLLFSGASIFLVFQYGLGYPDGGLFIATYFGYWFAGIAMLAVGMIASFLTGNLTVAFILGVLFNGPLAVAGVADAIIKNPTISQAVEHWSAAWQLHHFERGAIRLSSISYFLMIAVVAIYVCVILIGRRHWRGGADGRPLIGHYFVRVLSLLGIAVGVTIFFSDHAWLRADLTKEGLNSLAPATIDILKDIKNDDTVSTIKIDAFVSPRVPVAYAETRQSLLSLLDEIASLSGGKIQVRKHIIETFSPEATRASQTFGIEPRPLQVGTADARHEREIFLGVAFVCGIEKVVVPFVDLGIPIEYELVRSIATVAQQKRLKMGVLKTDVPLLGGGMMGRMTEELPLIRELKKQYDIVEVDPAKPIENNVNVLLAMQPSTLDPMAMDHFVDAVKAGIPTAIFEDPFPVSYGVVGTTQPKRPQSYMGMYAPQPTPKGDIRQLFKLLGIDLIDLGNKVVWQAYDPYPKFETSTVEWLFIGDGNGAHEPLNRESPITKGLKEVLFLFAGAWSKSPDSKLDMTDLAVTGPNSGTSRISDLEQASQWLYGDTMMMFDRQMEYRRESTGKQYNVAVHLHGKLPPEALLMDDLDTDDLSLDVEKPQKTPDGQQEESDTTKEVGIEEDPGKTEETGSEKQAVEEKESGKEEKESGNGTEKATAEDEGANLIDTAAGKTEINVVLVADIDWLLPAVFSLREMGERKDNPVNFRFQNVVFVLNILDTLAGEERFLDIRRRERQHRILTKIADQTEEARERATNQQEDFVDQIKEKISDAQAAYNERLAEVDERKDLSGDQKANIKEMIRREEQRKLSAKIARAEEERTSELKKIQRNLALDIRSVQDFYKFCAVLIPPIPPLLVAFFVFFHRRRSEQEGVSRARLR
ncbi:MAG: Gldg family protein, partial [Pirellulales bacterium]|nr:Gldg family protein [Pirellulales bacterium]